MYELVKKIVDILNSNQNKSLVQKLVIKDLSKQGISFFINNFDHMYSNHIGLMIKKLEHNVPKTTYNVKYKIIDIQVKKINDLFINDTVKLICKMYPRRDQRYATMTIYGKESIRERPKVEGTTCKSFASMDGYDQSDLSNPAFLYGGQPLSSARGVPKKKLDSTDGDNTKYAMSKYTDLIEGINDINDHRLKEFRAPPKLNTLRDDRFARANEYNAQRNGHANTNKAYFAENMQNNDEVGGHTYVINEDDEYVYDVATEHIYNNPMLRALNAPMDACSTDKDMWQPQSAYDHYRGKCNTKVYKRDFIDKAPSSWSVKNDDLFNLDTPCAKGSFMRNMDAIFNKGKAFGAKIPRFGFRLNNQPRRQCVGDYNEIDEAGYEEYLFEPQKRYTGTYYDDPSHEMSKLRSYADQYY